MNITKEKKIEILKKSYNVLKKDFSDNKSDIAEIIVKMYDSDNETAIKMFKTAIEDAKVAGGADLCGNFLLSFIDEARYNLKASVMDELIWNQPIMRRYLYEYGWWICNGEPTRWIRQKLATNELEIVDETLTVAYRNPSGKEHWDMLMDEIMPSSVTDEGYALLEKWCDKVTNETKRTKLNLRLLKYVDEVE